MAGADIDESAIPGSAPAHDRPLALAPSDAAATTN